MTPVRAAALVSDDVMFASRLRSALVGAGGSLAMARAGEVPEAVDAVFVDLNADVAARLEVIASLRRRAPGVTIVGFCHHGEKEVRQEGMAAGADQVVTNGALPEVALRLSGVRPAAAGPADSAHPGPEPA